MLNADDDLDTGGGTNLFNDPDPSYADVLTGGAGRDVFLTNNDGDQVVDPDARHCTPRHAPTRRSGHPAARRSADPGPVSSNPKAPVSGAPLNPLLDKDKRKLDGKKKKAKKKKAKKKAKKKKAKKKKAKKKKKKGRP